METEPPLPGEGVIPRLLLRAPEEEPPEYEGREELPEPPAELRAGVLLPPPLRVMPLPLLPLLLPPELPRELPRDCCKALLRELDREELTELEPIDRLGLEARLGEEVCALLAGREAEGPADERLPELRDDR